MFDDTLEDENIFGWIGLKDNGSHYVSATGLYDYFWSIKQETREKILNGWITALEAYLDPEFEKRLESIPAIQPVRNEDLGRMASGWGYRIHPIYKVRKFHYGMDFSAPEGTEVFATGDGVVVKVKRLYHFFCSRF